MEQVLKDKEEEKKKEVRKEVGRSELRRGMEQTGQNGQEHKGVASGLDRGVRWREPAQGGRKGILKGSVAPALASGNTANAALVATSTAKEVSDKRVKAFRKGGLAASLAEIADEARITSFRPLELDDYRIVFISSGLRIDCILTLYSRTGSKNGKHTAITDSPSVSAVSYIGLQIFEHHHASHFSAYPYSTAIVNANQFLFIQPIRFLMVLPRSSISLQPDFTLDEEYMNHFRQFKSQEAHLAALVKAFNSQGKKGARNTEDVDDDSADAGC
ncbi:hypothetical protein EST38_g13134 [Candolleomyces aberdarensis]|uniref:Uncharacterized protein n=1 Tax=Candolleomyces aberdarensis TaxID=2316362 RepID=A0A4Q2D2Z9_9AGAR|nr:hypothetical protein EST38_g13134 [Candolleomyces aberdarensis]